MNMFLIVFSVLFNQFIVYLSEQLGLSIKKSVLLYIFSNFIYSSIYEFFLRDSVVTLKQSITNIVFVCIIFTVLDLFCISLIKILILKTKSKPLRLKTLSMFEKGVLLIAVSVCASSWGTPHQIH